MFRTWTFSAGAIFTGEMREGRRGICYAEVAKHASSARGLWDRMPTGWLHAAHTRRKRLRYAEENWG